MITVVIPAYNEEKYLARCLKSLKEQDYSGQSEIIVVDNGSNDNTVQIAYNFGVRVISCPRRGVVHAREAGFRASSGEIIVQADADTIYPLNWLSRMARYFSSHSEVIAVAGNVLYPASPLWAKPLHLLRRITNSFSSYLWGKPAICSGAAFAFRREALLKAGGYNTNLPSTGDEYDLVVRLSKIGKIIYDRRLSALTSSRRCCIGFWRYLFIDWLYHTVLEQILFRLIGKSLTGLRVCPREEYLRRPSYRLARAWPIGIVATILGILSYGYFSPASGVFGKTYDQVASPQKVIALTFDDGPNEPYTSQVLDILDSYGIKATFFVVGKNVEYYPDVARRIVMEGHTLGNHSYTHKVLTEFEVPDYSEVDRAQNAIYQITGVKPHLFRPPYGRKTPWQLEYVKGEGLLTVTWSDSAKDPHRPPPHLIEEQILQHAHSGRIILLHDGDGTKHGSDRSQTVAALPHIIESLKVQGFTFVTVPELLQVSPYIQ